MPVHYQTQLDFIYFFYGLAFILLGVLCFVVTRGRLPEASSVRMVGLFGLVHGVAEWMAMAGLVTGETAEFAALRTVVIVGSFMLLTEAARRGAIRLGYRAPGLWIYPAGAVALALAGYAAGLATADALARYSFGLVGAFGTAAVTFASRNLYDPEIRPIKIGVAAGFALYGVATGLIVAPAPFWPANWINDVWLVQLTGVPILLVRGSTAILLSVVASIAWGWLLTRSVDSRLYTAFLKRHAFVAFSVLVLILVLGWALTNAIGDIVRAKIEREGIGESDVLVGWVARETATIDAMVQVLSGLPMVATAVVSRTEADRVQLQAALDLDVRVAGARLGWIFDSSGNLLVSSERLQLELLGAPPNPETHPWFKDALAGGAGRELAIDPTGARSYLTSYPIRAADRTIVGVAVLETSLESLDAHLRRFNHAFFVLDPRGVVVLTNRPAELQRTLWASPDFPPQSLSEQLGAPERAAMLTHEIRGDEWVSVAGRPGYAIRRAIGDTGWSLVLTLPMTEVFAGRLLGIIITLQVAIALLIYFMGRERGVRDRIQRLRRGQLQNRARNLAHKAATDALTGIANRLRFNERLQEELVRHERTGVALSLIIYDVDHFKKINDLYGHSRGDQVLVQLARTVAANVRQTDLLARWGGEEFTILLIDTDLLGAAEAAEKLRVLIAHTPFDQVGTVTSSFGVAELRAGDSAEILLTRADNALYRAKFKGRNRVELDMPVVHNVGLSPDAAKDFPQQTRA